jgi:RhtB (resistance to homoserine/threonine) family protein
MDPQLVAFAGLALALTLTPGADTALVTKNAVAHGRRAAFLSTLGICLGVSLHATASALGLSAIISQSALAFEVVKWLGAGYLVFLGIQALRGEGRHVAAGDGPGAATAATAANDAPWAGQAFWQGLFTNVLNPKVALFYLTLLPQFISPGDPVLQRSLLLAAIHIGMGLVWLSAYAYFISRLAETMARPSVKRNIERVTGVLLVGLGVRLALERR